MVKEKFELAKFDIIVKGLLKNHNSVYTVYTHEVGLHDIYTSKDRQDYIKELQDLLREDFTNMYIVGSVILKCYTVKWDSNKNKDVFSRLIRKHVYDRDPLYLAHPGTVYRCTTESTEVIIPEQKIISAILQDIADTIQYVAS